MGRANAASARTVWRMLLVNIGQFFFSQMSSLGKFKVLLLAVRTVEKMHTSTSTRTAANAPLKVGLVIGFLACSKQRNV